MSPLANSKLHREPLIFSLTVITSSADLGLSPFPALIFPYVISIEIRNGMFPLFSSTQQTCYGDVRFFCFRLLTDRLPPLAHAETPPQIPRVFFTNLPLR